MTVETNLIEKFRAAHARTKFKSLPSKIYLYGTEKENDELLEALEDLALPESEE